MSDLSQLVSALRSLEDRLVSCNKCGFCMGTCPVFGQTLLEGDVSRGKLALLSNFSQEILKDIDAVSARLSRCLLCGACQHTCPSGTETFDIFVRAREIIAAYKGLSPIKKLIFRHLLPHPRLLSFMMAAGSPFTGLVMPKDNNPQQTAQAPLLRRFIGRRHLPSVAGKTFASEVGAQDTPAGKSGLRVAFFPGCMGDKAYLDMSRACLKVFRHHGVGVFMPADLVCCGLPALTSGDTEAFTRLAVLNAQSLGRSHFDYIVTPCPSCTMTIRDLWGRYAANLPEDARRIIAEIAPKAIDINVFLVDVLKAVTPVEPDADAKTVTYHDPCHLRLSLACTAEPRTLLRANPGYRLTEMNEADRCCGCGGSFTLAEPALSEDIGSRKLNNIMATNADVVATACPACMMQISDMLARKGGKARVRHAVEVYAETL